MQELQGLCFEAAALYPACEPFIRAAQARIRKHPWLPKISRPPLMDVITPAPQPVGLEAKLTLAASKPTSPAWVQDLQVPDPQPAAWLTPVQSVSCALLEFSWHPHVSEGEPGTGWFAC